MSWAPLPRPESRGNKPGTPYEECFVPLENMRKHSQGRVRRTPLLEHWSAPRETWEETLSPSPPPHYRVTAIFQDDEKPMRECRVGQRSLGQTVDTWSGLDGLFCLLVQPYEGPE